MRSIRSTPPIEEAARRYLEARALAKEAEEERKAAGQRLAELAAGADAIEGAGWIATFSWREEVQVPAHIKPARMHMDIRETKSDERPQELVR